jgi:putative cell wall-binding protein
MLLSLERRGSGDIWNEGELRWKEMIQDHLDKIEERLKQSEAVKDSDKAELLTLLTTLRTEIADLSQTHYEQAESITGFAELSAREATRSEKNPALLNLSIEGLASSVQGFETSHPRLVEIINTFCTMLSNLGI